METISSTAIERIRAYARYRGWGRYRLAAEAGLAINTCRKMYQPNWNPRYETIRKLEELIPPDWHPPKNGHDQDDGE